MKVKAKKYTFFIIVAIIIGLLILAVFGAPHVKGAKEMRFGIDIRGGVEAIYEPVDLDRAATSDELNAARSVIETRLDNKNILDREVTIDKKNGRIIVRFPWKSDEAEFIPEKAISELGETARLTFRDSEGNILIEGKDVKSSRAVMDQKTNQYMVSLVFNEEGSKLFEEATAKLIGQQLFIFMDETYISSPTVNEKISGGEAVINGTFTIDEAQDLAEKISSGALPFSMTATSHNTISPSLGSGALKVMVMAGITAFALICLFMLVFYRLPGFISCIALTLQLAVQILALSVPQFTLTLPGIAGIILSLGMGVDANVIINERIGEELRSGKSLPLALKSGYSRAFASVFDGNITTAIVAIILMALGSGTMLSFGYTLLVGIVLNFVAGIYTTHKLLLSLINFKAFRNIKLYHLPKERKTIPFYKKRWGLYSISIVLMVIGIASCFINGIALDTTFKGGAMLTYTYTGDLNVEDVSRLATSTLNRNVTGQITEDLGNKQQKIVLSLAGTDSLNAKDQVKLDEALDKAYAANKLELSESYMVEPYIGKETLIRSIMSLVIALALIVVYVWVRFKKIGGLSAGAMALVALGHDILVIFFTFVVLRIPLDTNFIAVALTIIGYSINDTVVIYDRIRENMALNSKNMEVLMDDSLTQTLTRSINTSVTTSISVLIMYIFAYVFGIESIKVFALPMMMGVLSGCFSSVCLAGPLWVSWKNSKKFNKGAHVKTA